VYGMHKVYLGVCSINTEGTVGYLCLYKEQ